MVGRGILQLGEDPDRLDAHAVVGGNRRVLPIVVDPLLLRFGLGGVDPHLVILRFFGIRCHGACWITGHGGDSGEQNQDS